jgi:hypothetical protein
MEVTQKGQKMATLYEMANEIDYLTDGLTGLRSEVLYDDRKSLDAKVEAFREIARALRNIVRESGYLTEDQLAEMLS